MKDLDKLFPKETQQILPLNYQLITRKSLGKGGPHIGFTKSIYYNAEEYASYRFYKPISKLLKL